MKKKISAILAAILTLSAVSAVYAADYSDPPQYIRPPISQSRPTGPGSSSSIPSPSSVPSASKPATPNTPAVKPATNPAKRPPKAGTDISNPLSVVDNNTGSEAVSSGSPLYASYENVAVKSGVLAALARTNFGTLTIITQRYTIKIDSDSVTELKDIDLGMKLTKNSKAGALIIRTNQSGSYGCTVNMIISSKYYAQAGVNLNKAHIYYVDNSKRVYDTGRVILDETGNISLPMTNGGKYIIM